MKYNIAKNKYGFYQVTPPPTSKELEDFYANKYYQREICGGTYAHNYSSEELVHIKNVAKISEYIWYAFRNKKGTLLDVGCGEGFFANYFMNQSWEVTAVDFSDFGIKLHNSAVKKFFIQGNAVDVLLDLSREKKQFDFINYQNVLEHVVDPLVSLKRIKAVMHHGSVLRIQVPNDFSSYQLMLKSKKLIDKEYWVCAPEHLNYFSYNSLKNFVENCGFRVIEAYGDFPIEIFLSNSYSNYVLNKNVGKFAHQSRLLVDNFLVNQGIDKYINWLRSVLSVGMSRSIIIIMYVELVR